MISPRVVVRPLSYPSEGSCNGCYGPAFRVVEFGTRSAQGAVWATHLRLCRGCFSKLRSAMRDVRER